MNVACLSWLSASKILVMKFLKHLSKFLTIKNKQVVIIHVLRGAMDYSKFLYSPDEE